jgi:hypothetical protein
MVIGLALVFWARRDEPRREPVEPTTGFEETTPGGSIQIRSSRRRKKSASTGAEKNDKRPTTTERF